MAERSYALERLYEDQEPDLVADTIPAVLAWLGLNSDSAGPSSSFKVRLGGASARTTEDIVLMLRWNADALDRRCPGTLARARRMRSRKTADREHLVELAAYGLALVGISVWMPGRRAITFREGLPPDILLDDTDGAVRGVEVAGRTTGGFSALRIVLEGSKQTPGGKRSRLVERSDIAEGHVSLWCIAPPVSLLLQVKP
jgi:hypothetical protein